MNDKFDIRGVNHIALVCRDMAATVRFYCDVLGMPLVKTIAMPGNAQHFFFDIGNGDHLAFFWFPDAGPSVPGVSNAGSLPGGENFVTVHGSMNHLAFNVPLERFEEYRERLIAEGVEVSGVLDHDDSVFGIAWSFHDGVFVRSFYFRDPDGILLEFAAWTRKMGLPTDTLVSPHGADGQPNGTV